MGQARPRLTREQVLAYRRSTGALDARLPWGERSLRRAAWAGLQDSMPRAALLSIHARVAGTPADALDHELLTQVWGPRFSVFVVTEEDAAIFTLGRLPEAGPMLERAAGVIDRLEDLLGDSRMTYSEAGHALGVGPNSLRYGTLTGRIRISWDGARRPEIWLAPAPAMDPADARRELARRYLHVLGPGFADGFAAWAGVKPAAARSVFADIDTVAVDTPVGERQVLASDIEQLTREPMPPDAARLLPSGDAYWLYWGEDRGLLVDDTARRDELWTSRVWPGALLVHGEIVGVWRRSKARVTVEPWRRLSAAEVDAVEHEAGSLPLPDGAITVDWAV